MALDRFWQRIAKLTLGLLAFNAATHVIMPGLNLQALQRFMQNAQGGLLWLYDRMGGGGLSRVSIVALGFMPYFSARIGMLLARQVSPALAKLSESANGQRKLKWWTRGLTVGLSMIQSYGFAQSLLNVPGLVLDPGPGFVVRMMATLTGGALVAMLLSESVEEIALDAMGASHSGEEALASDEPPRELTAGPAQPLQATTREPEKSATPL